MTAAMTPIDKNISEYKVLASKIKDLEAQKEELKSAIRAKLGVVVKYVGPRGSVARITFMKRKTDYDRAKELLEADVYYEIVTESQVEQLRVS